MGTSIEDCGFGDVEAGASSCVRVRKWNRHVYGGNYYGICLRRIGLPGFDGRLVEWYVRG